MALFPAYSGGFDKTNDLEHEKEEIIELSHPGQPKSWLSNESFVPPKTIKSVEEKPTLTNEQIDSVLSGADVEIIYEKPKPSSKKVKKRHRRQKSDDEDEEKSSKLKKKKTIEKRPQHEKIESIFIKPDIPGVVKSKNQLFSYDLKRDIENLQFGSVYKKQRALFKSKLKFCLGANSKTNSLLYPDILGKKDNTSDRYFGRKSTKFPSDPLQILPKKSSVKKLDISSTVDEFIPVESEIKINEEKFVYDPSIQMYRPISSAVSSEYASFIEEGKEDETIFLEDIEIVRENKRYSKLLTENPNDIRLWRQFITFQDTFYEAKARRNKFKMTKLALLERKLAILDKAVQKNSNSYELKLLRMDIGLEAGWDREKLKEEWKRLEFNHVNQPEVWIGRLKFANSHFSHFTVSRQALLFDHCLEKLSTVLKHQLVTHPCLPGTELFFVECILAKVDLWKTSGHLEKAVAFCQSLLEFNFRQPEIVAKKMNVLKEKRQFFEPFWDSNCPRFGEDGALGWDQVMQMKQQQSLTVDLESDTVELNKIEDEICSDLSKNQGQVWLEIETQRQSYHWKPYKGTDEPEDPDRVVLLDDIENCLYEISEPRNRFILILKCLKTFGVRLPSFLSTNEEISWYEDDELDDCFEIFDNLPKLKSFKTNFKHFDEFLSNVFDQLETFFIEKVKKCYLTYVRIYNFASTLSRNDDVSSKDKRKTFTKFAKQILSKDSHRNDVILYGAYAEGLCKLDSLNEAIQVLQTALVNFNVNILNLQSNSFDQLIYLYLFNLLVGFYQQNATSGESLKEIAKLLANFVINGQISFNKLDDGGINFVIAKKRFLDVLSRLDDSTVGNSSSFLVSWLGDAKTIMTNLFTVFLYCLTNDVEGSLEKLLSHRTMLKNNMEITFDKNDPVYLSLDKNVERLFENELNLITFHLKLFWCPPKLLKHSVTEALENYPANGKFLKLYCDLHLHGQLMVQLRRFFSKPLTGRPVWWIAAIYAEFSRYLIIKEQNDEFCQTYKMRHVFENALDSCKNNRTLWRLFIKMELLWGEKENAKKLLYQAVRQCPGSKDLYMEGISSFPDDFHTFVDLMTEKELRVRLPLEELNLLLKAARQQNDDVISDIDDKEEEEHVNNTVKEESINETVH